MAPPTIRDVAQRAGVSKSLVSLVLRGATNVSDLRREAVLRAADELGYRPNAVARSLVRQRSHHLGLMVSDLQNPYFAEVAAGVMSAATARGYRVVLNTGFMSPAREADALDALLELRMDGILVAGARVASSVLRAAADIVPVVCVTRQVRVPGVDVVVNDDRLGARLVVDHLVGLGHRRITHIDGGRGSGAKSRARGFLTAMAAHDLAETARLIPGEYTEEAGVDGVSRLLAERSLPTAVFCANDYQAVGALNALEEAGLRVPDDVSLVGYDNVHLAAFRQIALTTVHQPRHEMGQHAAQLVLERIEGERDETRRILIPPELVIRSTTAPPTR